MHFPYDAKLFKKHALFYVAVQVVLWIKVTLFYFLYGQGILLRLIEPSYTLAPLLMPGIFTSNLLILDWLFHTAIHVALGVMFYLFARSAKTIKLAELVPLVFIADALHNVGYWFTNSFTSFNGLALDFIDDFVLMALFFYFFRLLCSKSKWFTNILPGKW